MGRKHSLTEPLWKSRFIETMKKGCSLDAPGWSTRREGREGKLICSEVRERANGGTVDGLGQTNDEQS